MNKINCLWGCQHRYFGKNASAFVIADFSKAYDPHKIVGCNKCHRQKWVKL